MLIIKLVSQNENTKDRCKYINIKYKFIYDKLKENKIKLLIY